LKEGNGILVRRDGISIEGKFEAGKLLEIKKCSKIVVYVIFDTLETYKVESEGKIWESGSGRGKITVSEFKEKNKESQPIFEYFGKLKKFVYPLDGIVTYKRYTFSYNEYNPTDIFHQNGSHFSLKLNLTDKLIFPSTISNGTFHLKFDTYTLIGKIKCSSFPTISKILSKNYFGFLENDENSKILT
jgi:hypothetical protein